MTESILHIFPRYRSHESASCFNCQADLDGSYWSESGCGRGRGQFMQHCEKCGVTTWYDLGGKR